MTPSSTTLLLATQSGFHLLHQTTGKLHPIPQHTNKSPLTKTSDSSASSSTSASSSVPVSLSPALDPESHLPNNRYNDGKVDPRGRFWVGSMDLNEAKGAGSLYRIDPHPSTRSTSLPLSLSSGSSSSWRVDTALTGVTISNGIVWTKDAKTMYYIDTPTRQVDAFDYDADSGAISNRRQICCIKDGYPDGCTIDSDDRLWIAHWGGRRVSEWEVNSERTQATKIRQILLPVEFVTSVAFGGDKLTDLFVTTASNEVTGMKEAVMELKEGKRKRFEVGDAIDGEELRKELSGSVFVIRGLGVTGVPNVPFAGSLHHPDEKEETTGKL